jgi:hypothetical protein
VLSRDITTPTTTGTSPIPAKAIQMMHLKDISNRWKEKAGHHLLVKEIP